MGRELPQEVAVDLAEKEMLNSARTLIEFLTVKFHYHVAIESFLVNQKCKV